MRCDWTLLILYQGLLLGSGVGCRQKLKMLLFALRGTNLLLPRFKKYRCDADSILLIASWVLYCGYFHVYVLVFCK